MPDEQPQGDPERDYAAEEREALRLQRERERKAIREQRERE